MNTTADIDGREISMDLAAMQPPFRGQIWELCADAPMGKGHSNGGLPFDIRTACYLREPLMAMRDPAVRKVVCKAGVKTLKTFIAEMAAAYQINTGQGDVGLYMADGEMARDHAKGRLIDYWYAIKPLPPWWPPSEAGMMRPRPSFTFRARPFASGRRTTARCKISIWRPRLFATPIASATPD